MSDSRPSIRDTIKHGRFTTRDLGVVPEKQRRDSSSTIDSGTFTPGFEKHVAREGDVLLMPLDLGIDGVEPDCYLAATPSIITYTVGRGYSTVRMDEIDLPYRDLPTIEEMPSPTDVHFEAPHDPFGYPVISPPPNFQPIQSSYYENQHYADAPASLNTQMLSHSEVEQQPQPMNSERHNDMENRGVAASPQWSVNSPTRSVNTRPRPPQQGSPESNEKLGLATGVSAWPLTDDVNSTVRPSQNAPPYSPRSDFSPGTTTLQNTPNWKELQDFKSRFSWYDAEDMRRSWLQRWFHDWWLLETTCLFLSAAFMAVIGVLGWRYNGTEMPQAWAFGITLNALVAILAAFSRVSLLFPAAEALGQIQWYFSSKDAQRREDFEISEEARRGPLGSIKLLARTKRM
jgi:Protein of unknown function (DUF3176)